MAGKALSLIGPIAKDHPVGKGSTAALVSVRSVVQPALDGDRWYAAEMNIAHHHVRSGAVVEAVDASVGKLD